MSKETVIKNASAAVEKLLSQYRDYLGVQAKIDLLDHERMGVAVRIGKEKSKKISEVLSERSCFPEFADLDKKESDLKVELQRISDAMTFANPVIWMMYKHLAYQGTSSAINTMKDMRQHCAKPGYICTKRFQFLNAYLRGKKETDLADVREYPDEMGLPELYNSDLLVNVSDDSEFLSGWSGHEFYQDGDRVAKWENFNG